MTVEIISCGVPVATGGWERKFYAVTYDTIEKDGTTRDESVRDANHALGILKDLCFTDGEKGFGFTEGNPPADATKIISVYVIVTNSRGKKTHYSTAYRRHAFGGVWDRAVEEMMTEVYKPIRGILRSAKRKLEEQK